MCDAWLRRKLASRSRRLHLSGPSPAGDDGERDGRPPWTLGPLGLPESSSQLRQSITTTADLTAGFMGAAAMRAECSNAKKKGASIAGHAPLAVAAEPYGLVIRFRYGRVISCHELASRS